MNSKQLSNKKLEIAGFIHLSVHLGEIQTEEEEYIWGNNLNVFKSFLEVFMKFIHNVLVFATVKQIFSIPIKNPPKV